MNTHTQAPTHIRRLSPTYVLPLLAISGLLLQHTHTLPLTPLHHLADKDHALNRVFVKQGWAWTSAAVAIAHTAAHTSRAQRLRALRQYAWLLAWWFVCTQGVPWPGGSAGTSLLGWTLTPPLMDRVFTWTGGACSYDVFAPGSGSGAVDPAFHGTETPQRRARLLRGLLRRLQGWARSSAGAETRVHAAAEQLACALDGETCRADSDALSGNAAVREYAHALHPYAGASSRACRALGGYWSGGHDPSGHVFLLCVMLVYVGAQWRACGRSRVARAVLGGVAGVWGVSLVVTCAAFHTPWEKAVGFVCGYVFAMRVVRRA